MCSGLYIHSVFPPVLWLPLFLRSNTVLKYKTCITACFKESGSVERKCSLYTCTKELKNLVALISDFKVLTIFLQSTVTYFNNWPVVPPCSCIQNLKMTNNNKKLVREKKRLLLVEKTSKEWLITSRFGIFLLAFAKVGMHSHHKCR